VQVATHTTTGIGIPVMIWTL